MLRKIIVFMLELVFILVLGVVIFSIVAGIIQGLIIGGTVGIMAIGIAFYAMAINYVLTHLAVIVGGGLLTFGGYITYRVLTDDGPL